MERVDEGAARQLAWGEATAELQEIVDAFHVSHCVFMVSVHNRITVSPSPHPW